jgi:uncharacterized protein YcfJ
MKSGLQGCVIAVVLAALPLGASAIGKNEKGCLVGGAVGGVGGHVLGDHALLGAAAGCAVGAVVADKRKNKDVAVKEKRAKTVKRYPQPPVDKTASR